MRTFLFHTDTAFSPPVTLTTEKIARIREQAWSVSIPEEMQNSILSFKRQLEHQESEDDENVRVSDRRWKKITWVLKVAAAANGNEIFDRSMVLLLQHLLWDLPEQKERIRSLIIDHIVTGGTDTERLEVGTPRCIRCSLMRMELTKMSGYRSLSSPMTVTGTSRRSSHSEN